MFKCSLYIKCTYLKYKIPIQIAYFKQPLFSIEIYFLFKYQYRFEIENPYSNIACLNGFSKTIFYLSRVFDHPMTIFYLNGLRSYYFDYFCPLIETFEWQHKPIIKGKQDQWVSRYAFHLTLPILSFLF